MHRPPADAPVDLLLDRRHPAQRRLAFEELLAHQLSLKLLRQRIQQDPGWPLAGDGALEARLLASLPFRPTPAQVRVLEEIEADLELAKPMLRLVQGDVGCGKTLVAALAATRAIETRSPGRADGADRAARRSARAEFPPLVRAAGHRGRARSPAGRPARRAARCARQLREGRAPLVIGTHALFQEGVEFASLALVDRR